MRSSLRETRISKEIIERLYFLLLEREMKIIDFSIFFIFNDAGAVFIKDYVDNKNDIQEYINKIKVIQNEQNN
jgi:hypothetical protein